MFEATKFSNLFRGARRRAERGDAATSVSQRSLFTAWLATTGALLVVSLLISVDATTGISLNQAGANNPDPANPVATELASADPDLPSIVYGSMQWTLIDARLVPREKEAFSQPVVILDMVARNLDGEFQARARSRDMVLILEDGTRAPLDRFEHTPSTYRIAVDPGQAIPVTLVFKPAVTIDPWLPDLVLQIGEQHHRPADLALNGTLPAEVFPRATTVTPAPGASSVVVTQAEIDINAGPYRARLDEQLVNIDVEVTDIDALDSAVRSRGFWQLAVTGRSPDGAEIKAEPITPYLVSTLPATGDGDGSATRSLSVLFSVPDHLAPTEMILSTGPEITPVARIVPTSPVK